MHLSAACRLGFALGLVLGLASQKLPAARAFAAPGAVEASADQVANSLEPAAAELVPDSEPAADESSPAAKRAATREAVRKQPQVARVPRALAPGVMEEVDPQRRPTETFSRHDIPELLKVDNTFDWARDIRFEHPIWSLDFSFKPMRMIEVDVPDRSGRMVRKLVWYLLYSVKNPGPEPVSFQPWFVLESRDGKRQVRYPDRLIPVALEAIERRERPGHTLYDSVSIQGELPPSVPGEDHTRWGVATWEDIDPRIDRFAVVVWGLTNAYRWRDDPQTGAHQAKRKVLRINFWRPSDEFFEHEAEIRLGYPGEVDYLWAYR